MAWSTQLDSDGNIRVVIEGYLDEGGASSSVDEVLKLFGGQPRELILEVTKMTGYRRNARVAWQKGLWEHRGLLTRIVMVGGNSVVRMGGSVMAMFLGVPLAVIDADQLIEADAPVRRTRARSGSRSIARQVTRPMSRPVLGPTPPKVKPAPRRPRRERSWGGMVLQRLREESHPAL